MKALALAKCLYDLYKQQFGNDLDEMKLHKLMYFLQRESLLKNNVVLFDEPFHGWKFGPVLKSVRSAYKVAEENKTLPFADVESKTTTSSADTLVHYVLDTYGPLSSWKLSTLSHDELSWRLSRRGLKTGENGDAEMSLPAMKCDAAREKARRREAQDNAA